MSRPVDAVRCAVVGLGYWGPNIVRNLQEIPEASVDLVCDSRSDSLQAISDRYPAVRATPDFDSVLADDKIEAVLIATPVGTHARLAQSALEAGKHVFVEKPLAASGVEAEALRHLAAERRLTLMPGHTFLYSPPVNIVRDMIKRGDLGEIYFISSSRVNLGIHQSDVSVIWDLAPHDFSILRYWLDEMPEHVSAVTRSCVFPGMADVAFIDLTYGSGTIVHVELSWLAPSKLRRTAIVGSEKMVVYDDTSNEPVRVFDSGVTLRDPQTFGEYRLSYRTGDIVSPRIDPAEPLSLEMQDFCKAVREGVEPRSSAQLGCDVVRMIECVEESLARATARTDLPSGV
ncbi:MAG TPA: Gfo/Idh/MocA family oxidoreductase [Galbitalea sp.]